MDASRSTHHHGTRLVVATLALVLGVGWSVGGSGAAEVAPPPARTDSPTTAAPSTSEGGSFDVLTYNVAGLPAEISGEKPDVNIPLISPLLEPYDVVLTQEDFDWWKPGGLVDQLQLDFVNYHDRLRADTTHAFATPQHPGPEAAGVDLAVRPDPELGDGIGILSRLPLADFRVQAWHDCFGGLDTSDGGAADCGAMKGFRVATMDLDGLPVDVYSLHAEAGRTDRDQALQEADFAQLADFIDEHSQGRAVIVGGDTNLHGPGHPDGRGDADMVIWQGFLAELGLTDACVANGCAETGLIDRIAYRGSDVVELTSTDHDIPRQTFTDAQGEDLSDHLPVAVSFEWAPRAAEAPYLQALFQTTLGRNATESEVAYWGGLLDDGVGRTAVARRLFGTPEGRRGPAITSLYPAYLDRAIDASARTYWAELLGSGRPLDHVEVSVLGSPESWARAGGTRAGFVDRVFRRTLGRGADAAGSSHFVGLLDSGTPQTTVAGLIHGSLEARRTRVRLVTQALLHRPPTPAERDAAAETLRTTRDLRVVAAQIVASDEFHDAAT